MQIRKQAVLLGCALAVLGSAPSGFARIGVDEEPRGSASGGDSAGWDESEGGFVLHSSDGDYRLVVGGLIQSRFDAINWDDLVTTDNTVTFGVRRARLFFVGNFMGKQNSYYVQIAADSPDAFYDYPATGSNDFKLWDAWIKHEYSESFALKGGQFRTPFSRQNLTAPGKLQFPERSLANSLLERVFDRRDVGVEASGGFDEGKVQYALSLVNGDGPNSLNLDDRIAVYGRVAFSPTGDYGYSEGDLEDSETLASTFGVAFHYQKDAPGLADGDVRRVNLDGGLKKHGASIQGEFNWSELDPDSGSTDTLKSFYVQGGWFLRPARLEVVARASRALFEGSDNDESEYSAGLNLFCKGHRMKWQAAYSYLDDEAGSVTNHRFTGQVQLWF